MPENKTKVMKKRQMMTWRTNGSVLFDWCHVRTVAHKGHAANKKVAANKKRC